MIHDKKDPSYNFVYDVAYEDGYDDGFDDGYNLITYSEVCDTEGLDARSALGDTYDDIDISDDISDDAYLEGYTIGYDVGYSAGRDAEGNPK